ncbi:S-layer homology domain-containing protein [Desulfuribacillus alkaliarsenatis]|uniref:SLH domain-containing protein n=1 Tax=Desulfuribacillus alkaliarsenatis TaxID=766136 RepID=A0A1E5G1V6_9FIRM|nr:S-layer homology domain-containing protein [Desulfuribacillus alkaliarsenatis]OEF96853.1 hypothetical protein BHF68_07275 [Desulfuribacillus alkaliarsenatis]
MLKVIRNRVAINHLIYILVGIVALTMVIGSEAATAKEMSIDQRMDVELSDLQLAAWAEPEIRQLILRGTIGGYPDGTFRPNNPIRKVEAIVMAVRALGLEQEMGQFTDLSDPYFYILEGQGLDWAKDYLRTARRNGLILNYVEELDWYEPANRAWMARLMVRMIGKVDEARDNQQRLFFQDRHQILPNQQGYVQVVQRERLMSGYPDNTFRPNATMTRAELSVLFMNYFNSYMTDYTLHKYNYGTIEEYLPASRELIVRTREQGLKKYTVHPKTLVFFLPTQGGERVVHKRNVSNLLPGQSIDYLLAGNEIVYIELRNENMRSQPNINRDFNFDIRGDIYYVGFYREQVQANNQGQGSQLGTVRFETVTGESQQYALAQGYTVTDINGNPSSLKKDALYRMYFSQMEDGEQVIHRLVEQDGRRTTYTGEVAMVNPVNSQVMVRHTQQQSETFLIADGIRLTFQSGEYVRVYAYGDYIYNWERLRPISDEGYFSKYDSERHELYLTDRWGKEQIYTLAENIQLSIPRVSRPTVDDIHEDDYVRVRFDRYDQNRNNKYDEVVQIQVVNQLMGSIITANSSRITFVDEHGIERIARVADNVAVTIPGNRQRAEIRDLRKHDRVQLRLHQGKVDQVTVFQRNVQEGVVFDLRVIDTGETILILGDHPYNQQVYLVTPDTRVQWQRFDNISLREIYTGQQVRVWYDGDEATHIELVDSGTVKGQVIDYAYQSLWLQGTQTPRVRFMTTDKFSDSDLRGYMGQIVELQFQDSRVTNIRILPEDAREYTLISVSLDELSIRVRADDGKQFVYWLPEETMLIDGYRQSVEKLEGLYRLRSKVEVEVVNGMVVSIKNGS